MRSGISGSSSSLCGTAARGCSRCRNAHCGAMQGGQCNSALPLIDQSPVLRAVITEPVVLDTPLLLPGAHKWRHGRFSWLSQALRLNQKQFAFPEFEERFATLSIGTSAEHSLAAFWSVKHNLTEQLESKSGARRLPRSSLVPMRDFLHTALLLTGAPRIVTNSRH